MSPHHRGVGWLEVGNIVLNADPVGVSVSVLVGVSVASCLHSISLMNEWILAKLTQIYHRVGKKCWLDFGDLTPFSSSHEGLDCWKMAAKWHVCTLSPEGTNGFWPNLHIYIARACKRTDKILVTLIPFLRSHEGLYCWKLACLHPVSWWNWWIFDQTCTFILLWHGK